MYDRRIKDRTLTLAVSGKLWANSLVMIDKETSSLWSHLLGESMQGKLTGTVLTQIPSVMTSWKQWKKRYRRSTVVKFSKTSFMYRMLEFDASEKMLIGLAENGLSRAWRLHKLKLQPVVNEDFGTRPIVVAYSKEMGTTVLYGRRVGDRILTFHWVDGKLMDMETKSIWNLLSGEATSGSLKGKRLPRLPGTVSFAHAWRSFHPESTYWQPTETGSTNKHPR